MRKDVIQAFFTVNQENNTCVCRLVWDAWDPRHIYFCLSTSSWSHSKQKGLPDFLVCASHQITTSMSLNEGADVRHMQICSHGGWETCWSEWLVRETHIHGNTSFLAWWFLKWLIRLQQLAKEKPCSRGGHTYLNSSVTFRDRLSFCWFLKAALRKITCWCLRCKRSTCEGC